MTLSVSSFMNAVANLTITGVTTKKTVLPEQINSDDLPLSFPRIPSIDEGPFTLDGEGGWSRCTTELVILLEPTEQDLYTVNFAATATMMDNVATALRGVALGTIAKSHLTWNIGGGTIVIGPRRFWAVVVRVSGNG